MEQSKMGETSGVSEIGTVHGGVNRGRGRRDDEAHTFQTRQGRRALSR
jgi:hypothetical protein